MEAISDDDLVQWMGKRKARMDQILHNLYGNIR
jgi:hypothetical protein